MKIIYEKEMTLIEYLIKELGIRSDSKDFNNEGEYNYVTDYYSCMDEEKKKSKTLKTNATILLI